MLPQRPQERVIGAGRADHADRLAFEVPEAFDACLFGSDDDDGIGVKQRDSLSLLRTIPVAAHHGELRLTLLEALERIGGAGARHDREPHRRAAGDEPAGKCRDQGSIVEVSRPDRHRQDSGSRKAIPCSRTKSDCDAHAAHHERPA